MYELERDFIRLVDDFVINSKEKVILEEIGQIDTEARLLGLSFYDMYCVTLQSVSSHQNLVSRFRSYLQNKKSS